MIDTNKGNKNVYYTELISYFNFNRLISCCKTSAHSLVCLSGSGGSTLDLLRPRVRERLPLPISPTTLTPDTCCARYLTSANELVACALNQAALSARCRKQSGGVYPSGCLSSSFAGSSIGRPSAHKVPYVRDSTCSMLSDSPGGMGFGCEGVMHGISTSLRRTESTSTAEKNATPCGRSSIPRRYANKHRVHKFATCSASAARYRSRSATR